MRLRVVPAAVRRGVPVRRRRVFRGCEFDALPAAAQLPHVAALTGAGQVLDLADALDSSVEWARALEITLIHRPVATSPWHVALSRLLVTSPCHVSLSRRLVTSPCHVALSRRLVTRPRDDAHSQAFRCSLTTGLFIPFLCPFRSHPRTGRPVIPALPPFSSTSRLPSSAPASVRGAWHFACWETVR